MLCEREDDGREQSKWEMLKNIKNRKGERREIYRKTWKNTAKTGKI